MSGSGNLRRGTSKPLGDARLPFAKVELPSDTPEEVTPAPVEELEITPEEEGIPQPDDEDPPAALDDSSELQLRVVELESEVETLKTQNAQLQAANENLAKTLASVTPAQAKASGPKYVGRISAPKLVPKEFLDSNGKPDMKAINAALNSDEDLIIAGIERRG